MLNVCNLWCCVFLCVSISTGYWCWIDILSTHSSLCIIHLDDTTTIDDTLLSGIVLMSGKCSCLVIWFSSKIKIIYALYIFNLSIHLWIRDPHCWHPETHWSSWDETLKILNILYRVRKWRTATLVSYGCLLKIVKKRKMMWYGHVRWSSGKKKILQGVILGRRRRGRQKLRWDDYTREWRHLSFVESQNADHDWHRFGLIFLLNDISTLGGYLMVKPSL